MLDPRQIDIEHVEGRLRRHAHMVRGNAEEASLGPFYLVISSSE